MTGVGWMNAANGQLPLSAMVPVEGFYFEPVTARCIAGLMGAARAAGHGISITQGYRALGKSTDPWNTEPVTQWSAWNAYKQGHPLPGSAVVANAAVPGTSNHGAGVAVDFTGTGWHPYTALSTWLAAHARAYGFVFDVPSESWHAHRAYLPTASTASSGSTPLPSAAPQVPKKGDHMIIRNSKGAIGALLPDNSTPGKFAWHPIDTPEWARISPTGTDYLQVADAFFAECETYRNV